MIKALPGTFEDGIRTVHNADYGPKQALGDQFHSSDECLNVSHVRFAEDVKIGDAVRTKYSVTGTAALTIPDTVPVGSTVIVDSGGSFLAKFRDNGVPPKPSWRDYAEIYITGGTGAGQRGVIQDFTDTMLNILWLDPDGKFSNGLLKTALASDSTYFVCAPWLMETVVRTAGKGNVNGIVLAKASKFDYGLIGWCGSDQVYVGDAVEAGDSLYLSQSPADDAGEGMSPAAAPIAAPYATARHAGAAESLVMADIHCNPIGIVRELARELDRAFGYPDNPVNL